jgi:hypothetical protein
VLHYWNEAAPVSQYFTFIIDGNEQRKKKQERKGSKSSASRLGDQPYDTFHLFILILDFD